MSRIYRGIWQNSAPDLHDTAVAEFARWVDDKYGGTLHLEPGCDPVEFVAAPKGRKDQRDVRIDYRHVTCDTTGAEGTHLAMREEHDNGDRWVTNVRVLTGTDEQWVWVDTDNVTDDPYATRRPPVVAPGIVPALIGDSSVLGGYRLSTRPRAFRPDEIDGAANTILDPERDVPVVVFAYDRKDDTWVRRAEAAAKELAGLALVWLLPPDTVSLFKACIGTDLRVGEGAARTYLPAHGNGPINPERHRYIPADKLRHQHHGIGSRIIGTQLSNIAARMRPPVLYRDTLAELLAPAGDTNVLELADSAIAEAETELIQAQQMAAAAEDALFHARADLEAEQERSARLAALVSHLETQVGALSVNDRYEAEQTGPPVTVPDSTAAVKWAREHCTHLVIPDTALIDMNELDETHADRAGAQALLGAFLALDTYADSAWEGDFYNWTTRSGHARALSRRNVAMKESDTVIQNPKFAKQRTRPIDPAVGVGDTILMEAHIKVLTGNSPTVPRLYFWDDTRGRTGKIHVGALGTHRHFPNGSTS